MSHDHSQFAGCPGLAVFENRELSKDDSIQVFSSAQKPAVRDDDRRLSPIPGLENRETWGTLPRFPPNSERPGASVDHLSISVIWFPI